MNRTTIITALILVFAFIGIADSWYLYQSAVSGTDLSCDIGAGLDGCNIVAQSPYSRVFGVPLALYGTFFFAAIFGLTAIRSLFPRRELTRLIYQLSIFGAMASVVFLGIQFALINAICIYCIISAFLTFALFGAARALWKTR